MYIYIFSIYILHIYVIDCKIQFTICSITQSLPFLNKFTTTKTNLAFCYNNCCWHDGQLTQTKKLKVIAVQHEMCPFFFFIQNTLVPCQSPLPALLRMQRDSQQFFQRGGWYSLKPFISSRCKGRLHRSGELLTSNFTLTVCRAPCEPLSSQPNTSQQWIYCKSVD